MARKIEIEINNEVYVGDTSPARDQVEMLSIATQNGLLPYLTKNVKDMTIVSGIAGLNTMTFERLKELVIRKGEFKRASDNVPLSENLFQDQVHFFLLLLGRALAENVGPFWNLSSDENTDETDRSAVTRVDWFLWRPCTGMGQLCPPLAKWSDMTDGTYSLEEIQLMHDAMDDIYDAAEKAKA